MGSRSLVYEATRMKHRLIHPSTLVIVVIALGFALRLFHLDAQSFWYDEAMSAGIARGTMPQILRNDFYSPHPPLYFAGLHYWLAIGESDFAIRLLSAVLGVLGIAGIYSLGKVLFDDIVGLVAAIITSVAPYMVFYSQEARMYTLLFLLSSMLLVSYVRMLHTNSRRWWLAYTISAVLSLYVHLFSALLLLSLHLHLFIHQTTGRKRWERLAITDGLLILAFAPRVAISLVQVGRVAGDFWIPRPSLAQLFSAPYGFTLSQFLSETLVPLAFALVLLLFIITHLQISRELARRGDNSAGLNLLLWAFWGPLLSTFIISQWRSVYLERTLIVAVPALYLLFSWAAVRTRERYVNVVLLLLVGIFAISALHNWYFHPDFGKPPFRTAADFLQDTADPGEPIVHTSDGGFLIFMHYAADCRNYLLTGDPEPAVPVETYRLFGGEIIAKEELSARRFWLVVALDNSIEFQKDLVYWFDGQHKLVETYDFGGINLRYYDDTPISYLNGPSQPQALAYEGTVPTDPLSYQDPVLVKQASERNHGQQDEDIPSPA